MDDNCRKLGCDISLKLHINYFPVNSQFGENQGECFDQEVKYMERYQDRWDENMIEFFNIVERNSNYRDMIQVMVLDELNKFYRDHHL